MSCGCETTKRKESKLNPATIKYKEWSIPLYTEPGDIVEDAFIQGRDSLTLNPVVEYEILVNGKSATMVAPIKPGDFVEFIG